MFIPPFVGIESVATSDLSSAAASHAHTTTLTAPDYVWTKNYNWYPDTPGAYPASKWSWYYNNGGLYDQAHVITAESDAGTAAAAGEAHTTNLYANPNAPDFVWQKNYSTWYQDTPGQFPASKWTWYYNNGGLYDQVHASSDVGTLSAAGQAHSTNLYANPNAPDFVWQKNYSTWYQDTPGQYPTSKWTWYYNNGGLYDQSHALAPPVAPAQGEIAETTKPPAKPVAASPGHYLLCGQAAILGALTATGRMLTMENEASWEDNFKEAAKEAAQALSPVGGHIMREHLLQE